MPDAPLCAIRNLTWRPPGGEEPLLEAVDFELNYGESVAVTGRSGAGKSTLLRCLIGLQHRDAGRIFWRGEAVEGDRFRDFRQDVVYVHQEPTGIGGTVGENLAFARQRAGEGGESRDRQRALLDALDLGDVPDGQRFEDLSVGEKQRVALVRCLTLRPTALLLDEPTASLDRESMQQVEQMLADYRAEAPDQRSLVWVTHDAAQLQRVGARRVALDAL